MELCLISKETMEHEIKLPCNHSFEYIYLYHEIIEQKKHLRKGSIVHIVGHFMNIASLIMN